MTTNIKPDLTNVWIETSIRAADKEIDLRDMNDIWSAIRTLKRHGVIILDENTIS